MPKYFLDICKVFSLGTVTETAHNIKDQGDTLLVSKD